MSINLSGGLGPGFGRGEKVNLYMVDRRVFHVYLPFAEAVAAYEKALRRRRGLRLVDPTTDRLLLVNPQQCIYLGR